MKIWPFSTIKRLSDEVSTWESRFRMLSVEADTLDERLQESKAANERQAATIRDLHERGDRVPVLEAEIGRLKALIAPLDRDGDGKPGGSKPKIDARPPRA